MSNNIPNGTKNPRFSRNTLDQALSPYLRGHADNPVHWQEWSTETLQHARDTDKILLVSTGYSTCHWCHVMAADSFSDPACAEYLNRHFVSIKIDREERPDIDQYMMSFLLATTGSGGWPLNVFLSPDLKPFFAMTYAAPGPRFGRPGFLQILHRVKEYYDTHASSLQPVRMQASSPEPDEHNAVSDEDLITAIDSAMLDRADMVRGGFQGEQKFPPHCSLLYALHRIAADGTTPLNSLTRKTLDTMLLRGLHDHLQGGFFRYCVDQSWTTPHFEKMLYDQAMFLWAYSLASAIWKDPAYEETARGVVRCLSETFGEDGMFCAAHDADTHHAEGATYLWTRDEIAASLTAREFQVFEQAFELPGEGTFDGMIHLARRAGQEPGTKLNSVRPAAMSPVVLSACRKLLAVRRTRPQPFTDRKKIVSWNALTGIALLVASRTMQDKDTANQARTAALTLRNRIIAEYIRDDDTVRHGSISGSYLGGRFLEDHAAVLLFLTYCFEEDRQDGDRIARLSQSIESFRDTDAHTWISADEKDFFRVPAETFDSPAPSPSALAEFAVARSSMVLGKPYPQIRFGKPLTEDFLSVAALHTRGYVCTVQTPEPIAWHSLPVHTVQTTGSGTAITHCIRGVCSPGLPLQAG
jgi:uncharacterized protein